MATSSCPTPSATTWPKNPVADDVDESHPDVVAAVTTVRDRINTFLAINGECTVDSFHKELGAIVWEYCGMECNAKGIAQAIELIRALRGEFWTNLKVAGSNAELNRTLERAGRMADFFGLAEFMCIDALHRGESCGSHFRAESQTDDGEALRDDDGFAYVAAWEFDGDTIYVEPWHAESSPVVRDLIVDHSALDRIF